MIYGFHWPELVFCGVIFVCGCVGLWPEFRPGGAFSMKPAAEDSLAGLFELPLPEGVEPFDVLATLDWIEAL